MVYRGAKPREAKSFRVKELSTPEMKWRRHRNKVRIWRRAVKRLSVEVAV